MVLRRIDREQVAGSVQDDFHHFALRITHDEAVIRGVEAETIRAPWSTCPAASIPLQRLVGAALFERASDIGRVIDMRAQCTHLFDLVGLLVALAWRGDAGLGYDAYVRGEGPTFDARLDCNGEQMLHWQVVDNYVAGATSVSLGRGFREWTETLPVAPAEHAFVLRRAVFVAGGRRQRLEEWASPDDLRLPVDVCYSLGSVVRQTAIRTIGTRVDFAAMAATAGN
jgi:hypothetical protein